MFPFVLFNKDGKAEVFDHHTGERIAENYEGNVFVGSSVFYTWIENGERCWKVQ